MLTSQLIYGDLSDAAPVVGPSLPEVYNPICPLETHPADTTVMPDKQKHPGYQFNHRYKRADDPLLLERNARIAEEGRNAEGLIWGSWLELESDCVGPNVIPVIADIGETPWRLLPAEITHEKLLSVESRHPLQILCS